MPATFTRVQSGDVITADLWNQILATLEGLDGRVETLEQGGTTGNTLAITGLEPPSGPYHVGDTLTLLGRNFQFSLGAARVFLNATRVLTLDTAQSNDTRLVFTIPPVPGVTQSGTPVTLRVTNQTEEVSQPITLLPQDLPLFGDVDLAWVSVTPATIVPNQPATFRFTIASRASDTAEFTVTPTITVAVNQALWQSRLQLLDGNQLPLASGQIRLNPEQTRTFHVRISSVPTGTNGTEFQLRVDGGSGNVVGSTGGLPFEVGQLVEPPDPNIELLPTGSTPGGALAGSTATVSVGQTVRVRFNAFFHALGQYDLTLTPAAGTNGWTIARFINTPDSFPIEDGDLDPDTGARRTVEITLQTVAGSSDPGQVEVRLQRQGATAFRAFPLTLNRA